MAELIKMPFAVWTRVGPRNDLLDKGPDPAMWRGNYETENGWPTVKYNDTAVGHELLSNSWTDRDAICKMYSGESRTPFMIHTIQPVVKKVEQPV